MVNEDGGATYGFAWGGEEGLPDFDNAGRYSEQYRQYTSQFGFINSIVSLTGNTLVFSYNDEEIPIVYNELENDVVPVVPELTNAAPSLFSRDFPTVNNIKAVVNEYGQPVVVLVNNEQNFLEIGDDGGEMTVSLNSSAQDLAAIVAIAGQAEVISYEVSGDFKMFESLKGYKIVTNQDDIITFGELSNLTVLYTRLGLHDSFYIVNHNSELVVLNDNGTQKMITAPNEDGEPSDYMVAQVTDQELEQWGHIVVAATVDNDVYQFMVDGVSCLYDNNSGAFSPAVIKYQSA